MAKYFIYFSIYNKNNSKYGIYCQYKIVQFSYIYNHQKYKFFYLSTLTQKGHIIALPMKIKYVFFYCSRIDFRLFVQAAKQQAVRLSSDCVSGKYLWALPTPTTFEKVDQTFIITCQNTLLNHNFKLPLR